MAIRKKTLFNFITGVIMLSLTRRLNERIFINGTEIKIKVISISETQIKMSIDAPAHIKITKAENETDLNAI
jgi:carbon storage regulator CsrA